MTFRNTYYLPYYDWSADMDKGAWFDFRSDIADQRSLEGGYDSWEARDLLYDTLGRTFATPGKRNDDAVNICIALYAMGHDTGEGEFGIEGFLEKFLTDFCHMQKAQVDAFMEHVERVEPYLENWCRTHKFLAYAFRK